MFDPVLEVKVFHPHEVGVSSVGAVGDINRILKQQHSKAGRIDEKSLLAHVKNSRVVVALNGSGVVGIGQLLKVSTLSHTYFAIHNLAVLKGVGREIGISILEKLLEEVEDGALVEAGMLPDDSYGTAVLTIFGFKQRAKLRYRLKIKK